MITTKKTKRSIGATYKEPNTIAINGKRIPADAIAIAEINNELRKNAMERKVIMCEMKLLAKKMYTCGINSQEKQETVSNKTLKLRK